MTLARSLAPLAAWLLGALGLALGAPPGAEAQSDHELLHTCLDTFEGPKRSGRSFTREYGRHVLHCNFTVDILDEPERRRAAYEQWRTERHHQELARLDAREELVSEDAVRYAECLRDRADALVAARPEVVDDPDALRRVAEVVVAECAGQAGAP